MNFILAACARHLRRPVGLALLAAACSVVSLAARQQPRVFRTEVDAVPLDVVVLDREGRPVPDLRPEDFVVTVDGQPRKILSAQFLSSASAGAPARAAAPQTARWDIDEAFERTYVGNQRTSADEASPSRTVIIAIDQSSFQTAGGRAAAVAAQGLLDMLHPNDRVGLVVFPPPGPSVRPTRDRQRVRAALAQVTGGAETFPRTDVTITVADALIWSSGDPTSRSQILERACALQPQSMSLGGTSSFDVCRQALETGAAQVLQYAQRQTLVTLLGLGNAIRAGTADGSPAAVVVVGTGMYGAAHASQLGVDEEVKNLARLASASRVALYGVYVESGFLDRDSMDRGRVSGFSTGDADLRLEGLRHLAGLSGGTVTRVSAASSEAFRRVSLELSAYYLLGLEGVPGDRDGQRHRVRVRVGRPGLTVRTREDMYLPAVKKLTGDEAVRESLKAPQLERELPISLATQMLREPGTDKIRLLISAHVDRDVKAPSSVRIGYLIRGAGASGTAGESDIQVRKLPVAGSGPQATLSFVETVQLAPGRYLLRLAAADEKNRLGSAEQVVDAMLVGGEGGTFSDLLLLDPARPVKDTFAPVADGRMTGDALQAFLELYPHKGQAIGSVAFDISDTPGGPAIASGTVVPEKKEADRLAAGVNFDVRPLPPGTYMLNARALDGERLLGRVSRPFRLERAAGAGGPRAGFAFAGTGGLVRTFARQDALRQDALEYFLGRLREAEGAGTERPSVGTAAQALRNARFDATLAALTSETPDVLAVTFLKGLALFGQGQLEQAAGEFRASLRLSNDFLPAAFYLGACYAAGGRDREAVGAWQTSLVSEADSRIIYEVLADAWLRLKEPGRAQATIAEAQERWPADDVFAPRLAAAKALLNRRGEALAALAPYIDKHPGEAEPIFLAIRLLYEAYDGGKPIKSAADDKALAQKYAALYRDAAGAEQPLVNRWVAAMK